MNVMEHTYRWQEQVAVALPIAKAAHEGQYRVISPDFGLPYFDSHVMRVARAVPELARPVAILHDVMEFARVTAGQLEQSGVHRVVIEAVLLLSWQINEDYNDYIHRLVTRTKDMSPLAQQMALITKLAELGDNLAGLELSLQRKRYMHAMRKVTEAIDTLPFPY